MASRPGSASPSRRTHDVDSDLIGVDRRTVDRLELGELRSHPLDLRVDLLVARTRPRYLDPQPAVSGDAHARPHLDDGVERDRTILAARGDVDLGRRDHVDVVLADGLRVVLGECLAQRLLTRRGAADARFEDATGCLAWTKPGNAHFACDATKRRVHRFVELRLVDLDRNLDLVVLEGLDGALHRPGSIPARRERPAWANGSYDPRVCSRGCACFSARRAEIGPNGPWRHKGVIGTVNSREREPGDAPGGRLRGRKRSRAGGGSQPTQKLTGRAGASSPRPCSVSRARRRRPFAHSTVVSARPVSKRLRMRSDLERRGVAQW